MQPIPPRFPHIDPDRRTGRTTRMLIRALQTFMCDRPPEVVIVTHAMSWSRHLMIKFCEILDVLGVPYERVIKNNRIVVDDRVIRFECHPFSTLGMHKDAPIFEDHYKGR